MHSTHQTALESKHAALDGRIAQESGRPLPDSRLIAELKKQKLKLKEELARL